MPAAEGNIGVWRRSGGGVLIGKRQDDGGLRDAVVERESCFLETTGRKPNIRWRSLTEANPLFLANQFKEEQESQSGSAVIRKQVRCGTSSGRSPLPFMDFSHSCPCPDATKSWPGRICSGDSSSSVLGNSRYGFEKIFIFNLFSKFWKLVIGWCTVWKRITVSLDTTSHNVNMGPCHNKGGGMGVVSSFLQWNSILLLILINKGDGDCFAKNNHQGKNNKNEIKFLNINSISEKWKIKSQNTSVGQFHVSGDSIQSGGGPSLHWASFYR